MDEPLAVTLSRVKESIQQYGSGASGAIFSNLAALVQRCGKLSAIAEARQAEDLILGSGLGGDRLLGNLVIQMYGRCGDVQGCRSALARIKSPNVFSWTILIEAFAQNGHLWEAVEVFEAMPERNVVSWTTMVKAFASYGEIERAKEIFEKTPGKNATTWNAMLAAFAENGQEGQAIEHFGRMNLEGSKPDSITFVIILNVSSRAAGFCSRAKVKILQTMIESAGFAADLKIGNGLIGLFGHCCPDEARRIFDEMPERDIVSWNSMLWVYASNSFADKARNFFDSMVAKDVVSWNTMIASYARQLGSGKNVMELFHLMCLSGKYTGESTRMDLEAMLSSGLLLLTRMESVGACGMLEEH
ncbi:pentatricopeptide repeat-containing protein At1g62260, mitochondrial-like [Selaginella moellendorffii]|uniref:pentatricopeptide repeat-containing protein At1g62260, mitochondrial-like n=1 Tax=Selaginella moellendorffii TaxID=88036 RepID=UPI000D1C7C83|nr:pentatricopeptide repeat-containing protein At1g62260, mitochondrial-like [Selaginella moellendorffii]|eukprot:XP_024520936.1 pentatricopeptide repeat-containing protein At1g62260, mitochondrial-like [Selaginella moellendorffii]